MPRRSHADCLLDPTAVGLRLWVARTARGLSLSALDRASGVNRWTIAQAEAGRNLPALDTAARLADSLGVSLDWLCGRTSSSPSTPGTGRSGHAGEAEVGLTSSTGGDRTPADAVPQAVKGPCPTCERDDARELTPGVVNTSDAVTCVAARAS